MTAHQSIKEPLFKVREEVIVRGTYTEEGQQVRFGCTAVVQEVKLTPKRGFRYRVKLYDGAIKWFYEKRVEPCVSRFVVSSIL